MDENALYTVRSVQGHLIRITTKQWLHVIESHDYMAGNIDKVLETIADPDRVIMGSAGEVLALRAYESTNITQKTAVVVYRDVMNGFLITAFFTSKPEKIERKGQLIWSRSQES